MQIGTLIQIVIVLLILMFIGFAGARKGIFTPAVTKAMSFLVFNVFLASSAFSSICDNAPDMDASKLLQAIVVLTVVIMLPHLISMAAGIMFFRNNPSRSTAELCISVMNTLMFGLPIVQQVYGGMSVMYMGLSSVPFNLSLYSLSIWRLLRGGSESGIEKIKIKLKDILSPVLVATMLAMLFLLAEIPVHPILKKFLDSTAPATLPMSMIVIGATMAGGSLLETFSDKRVYVVCFARLIINPLLIWLILSPFNMDPMLLKTAVVIAGCPCGVVVSVMSLQYGKDALLASRSVMASTLLSVITLPIVILLLG